MTLKWLKLLSPYDDEQPHNKGSVLYNTRPLAAKAISNVQPP